MFPSFFLLRHHVQKLFFRNLIEDCVIYVYVLISSLFLLSLFMLQDQIRLEIFYTCKSVPLMAVPTVALFLLEVRGYSKLYDQVDSALGR